VYIVTEYNIDLAVGGKETWFRDLQIADFVTEWSRWVPGLA